MAVKMPSKSSRWNSLSAASASVADDPSPSISSSAAIMRRTAAMRSAVAKNMCSAGQPNQRGEKGAGVSGWGCAVCGVGEQRSQQRCGNAAALAPPPPCLHPSAPVRTRPMPCAPFLRATSASAGVSALVNTPILRNESTHSMNTASSPAAGGGEGGGVSAWGAAAPGRSAATALPCPIRTLPCPIRTHACPIRAHACPRPRTRHLGRLDALLAQQHLAGGAVEAEPVALAQGLAAQAGRLGAVVDLGAGAGVGWG